MMSRPIHRKSVFSIAGAFCLATAAAMLGAASPCFAETPGTGRAESIAARHGKAKTMAELAGMYDSGPCIECHRAIHDDWAQSTHSRSISGSTAAAILDAVQDGLMKWPYSGVKSPADVKVAHLMECATCHLPQLADAEDDVAREIVGVISDWQAASHDNNRAAAESAAAKLKSLNIGCLICHNRNAVVHKWTDGFPKDGELYGSRAGAHPAKTFATLKKSPIMGESLLCGQCHGLGPTLDLENPVQCSTIYGSYLYAYKSHGGQESCQDCHMRKSKLGHRTQAHSDPGMIKAAVDVRTDTHGFFWRSDREYLPRVIVDVTLLNKAGHAIPDSTSSEHRMILEVAARTPDGTQVFSQARTYMPIPQRFGRGDKMGRGAYEKTGIVGDTALPPNRAIRERFDIILDPVTESKEKGNRLFAEVTILVKLRVLTPDDAATAEGAKWYELSKLVKIEEER